MSEEIGYIACLPFQGTVEDAIGYSPFLFPSKLIAGYLRGIEDAVTYIDLLHWHYLELVAEFINLLLHEEYSVFIGPVRTVLLQVNVIDVSIPSYVDSILG